MKKPELVTIYKIRYKLYSKAKNAYVGPFSGEVEGTSIEDAVERLRAYYNSAQVIDFKQIRELLR
jgi:hypothetical protein